VPSIESLEATRRVFNAYRVTKSPCVCKGDLLSKIEALAVPSCECPPSRPPSGVLRFERLRRARE